jgi:hypothetical protein
LDASFGTAKEMKMYIFLKEQNLYNSTKIKTGMNMFTG